MVTVDYNSTESLTSAFSGADAIVSAVDRFAVSCQFKMIDAAILAGVKWFLPSEYGADRFNENARALANYGEKNAVSHYLEEKAREGKISWTMIITGPFLDSGESELLQFYIDIRRLMTVSPSNERFNL